MRLRVGKHDSQGLFNVKRTYVLMRTRKIVFLKRTRIARITRMIRRVWMTKRTRISRIARIIRLTQNTFF